MLRLLRAPKIDATQGPLVKSMLVYALPIILSTIIQDLFNTIDLAVLARMGSLVAHASVGATSTITTLIVNSFFGLSKRSLPAFRSFKTYMHTVSVIYFLPFVFAFTKR